MQTNDVGKQIVSSLQSVREFHTTVAKLLQAATSAAAENGWKVPGGTAACGSSASRAIYKSRYWIPEDGFQFYRNEANPTHLAFVAVIFDDVKEPERVTEPIATAGWLSFVPDGPGAMGEYQFPWCRIALLADDESQMKGEWHDVEAAHVYQNAYYQVQAARALAHPLMSIQSEADLSQLIVEPLLQDLSLIANTATEP